MRKTNKPSSKNFTEVSNLVLNNSPLTWSPSTADKVVNPNDTVSVDWGIINKKAKANVKNVFALFLDTITGNVCLLRCRESRTSRTSTSGLHPTIWQAKQVDT